MPPHKQPKKLDWQQGGTINYKTNQFMTEQKSSLLTGLSTGKPPRQTASKLQVQKLGNTLTQQIQHVTAAVKNKVLKIPATNERSSTTKVQDAY